MCFNCNDDHCKERGFFKMHRCKNTFIWVASLAIMLASFIAMAAIYLIIRLNDDNWGDKSLPLSLVMGFVAIVAITLVVSATIDFKHRTGDAIYE
jgi:chromate transport protein ChrA